MRSRQETAAKLGDLLAARGKVDREVLLRALRHQRASGGRLGTCLLEIDAIGEEELLQALADQLKVPSVGAEDLRGVPPDTLRLVPARTASKLCAVPVRASGSQLSVAMRDPLDLAGLDELAFVSGRRVRPHAALEVRLHEALARHYKVDVSSRFEQLANRLNRARFLWSEAPASPRGAQGSPSAERSAGTGTASTPPPAAPAPSLAAEPQVEAVPAGGEAASRRDRERSGLSAPASETVPPAPVPPPPRSTLTLEAAESRMLQPGDRDAVADILVEFLLGRVDAALTLIVRRDEAAGWRGCGLPQEVAAAVRVTLAEPSVVLALRDGAPLHRGELAPLRGNAPLVAALGPDISDLLALPLRVRGRLVGVVLAMNRRSALAPGLAEDLQRLAVKASGALELLVLRQKLRRA